MDDDFYKERARQIREVATQADPFIKKRLLRLAGNYDAMITRTRSAVSSNLPKYLLISSQKITDVRRAKTAHRMVVRLLTGCRITVRISGIAGSEVSSNFGFDHSLPKLRSSEPRQT
jgi:hypothetical protein